MRNAVNVLAVLAGVGTLAGLVYLPVWLHREDPPPPSLAKKPSEVVLVDVPDTMLIGRHNGHKIWQIHARHIQSAADGQTTTFLGIDRGTLFEKDRPAARVTAQKAVYSAARRALVASGGLSLSSGGVTVHSTRLNWSATSSRVDCPEPVTISWAGGAATARTMTADTRLRVLTGRNIQMAARLEGPMFEKIARRLGAASGASLALFLAQPAVGQAATGQAAPSTQPVRYREVRVLRADMGRFEEASKIRTLEGNVVVEHGDTTLKADKVVYREGANTATVTGHVTVDNPRNHVEGDAADVDFNTKVIHLRGASGVKIVARPRTDGKPATGLRAQWKEPVTLACKSIDYHYKDKRAEAEGPLTVTRKGQTLTSDSAIYQAGQDLITLTGNVHGKDEKNQTFDAPSAKLSLKEGAEWMEAPNVRATFYVKDEEETPAAPSTPAKTAEAAEAK